MSSRFLLSLSLLQAVLVCSLLGACASTRMTSIRGPDFATRVFTAPSVLVVSNDAKHRHRFEDAFVADLKEQGVGCRSSWRLAPENSSYPSREFQDALTHAGVDALIVVSAGPGVNGLYVPIPVPDRTTRYSQAQFQGFRSVTNITTTVMELRTLHVAWVASSESSTNSMSDSDSEEVSYRKAAAERMAHERLFAVAAPARAVPAVTPAPAASAETPEIKGPPPAGEGLGWSALSRASLKLVPGQTRDEVIGILGPPTLTEYGVVDQNALTWRYEVGRSFVLLFEKKDDWRLARWSWP